LAVITAHGDPAMLVVVYPDLVTVARRELVVRHLDPQLAEDIADDAALRFLTARIQYSEQRRVRAWFRTTIARLVCDQARRPIRSRDMLDHATFSLSEPWARGGT
jgi:DNA-directed RNA polymerase specialized sigma24 family protein